MSQDLPNGASGNTTPALNGYHDFANKLVNGNYILDADLEDELYDVLYNEETSDFLPKLSEFQAADLCQFSRRLSLIRLRAILVFHINVNTKQRTNQQPQLERKIP